MVNVKQPLISVDNVVLRLVKKDLQILLVERWAEPYRGNLALPGVLLNTNETITEAAARAVYDKANISEKNYRGCEQLKVFDETNRDPRGATISVSCFGFVVPSTATSGEWVNVKDIPELPFDHNKIVSEALRKLKHPTEELLWGVLGETFTTGDYINLMDAVGVTVSKSNMSRIMPTMFDVVKLSEKRGNSTVWSLKNWKKNSK